MVPKSKILGKPPLVFITIGSTNFQFDRLFSAVEKCLSTVLPKPRLIVQTGNSSYLWHYKPIRQYKYLHPNEVIKLFNTADKIITHAGFGTLFMMSKTKAPMPFVVPRLHKFGEQVDDHQKYFLDFLKKKVPHKYHRFFFTEGYLVSEITQYIQSKPKKNIFRPHLFSDKNKTIVIRKLQKFIDAL